MESILKVDNLTKKYGSLTAVNDLNFEIHKGHVYGLLGPNGSGKSTTLGMVLNVVNPTSGTYHWFNGTMPHHEALKKIGAIIEHPNFYPGMDAVQNLELVCKIKEIPKHRIEEQLDVVGLLSRKRTKFKAFSLGMKQRLAIASALLNDPEILILDEPTNGLDPQGIRQIRDLIRKIAARGTTILLASHLLDEVEKVCSHVIVLRNGEHLYSGPVEEMDVSKEKVMDSSSSSGGHKVEEKQKIKPATGTLEIDAADRKRLVDFLKNQPFAKEIDESNTGITITLDGHTAPEDINKAAFEAGIVLSKLVYKRESLEDKFINLTK